MVMLQARPARAEMTRAKPQLLRSVHGLRALAAFSVVLFHLHYLSALPLPPEIGFVASHGGLGVQLFFVLSAFSLFYSTANSIGNEGWMGNYFIRRFFRIAPLFYFMLAMWTALLAYRGAPPDFSSIVLNVSLLFNLVPGEHVSIVAAGWTVGVEVLFYVLLPILLTTIERPSHALAFAAFAIPVSILIQSELNNAGGILKEYSYFSFASSLGAFALGIVAFKVFEFVRRAAPNSRFRITVIAGIAVVAVFASLFAIPSVPSGVGVMLWCLIFALVVCMQALAPASILGAAPMVYAAERSYGIYLTHPLVIFFLGPTNHRIYDGLQYFVGRWAFLACALLTLGVVVVASAAVHRLIEVPGMELGKFLIVLKNAKRCPTTPRPRVEHRLEPVERDRKGEEVQTL